MSVTDDYRSLMYSSPLAMFLVDPHESRVIDANPAFEKLLGYSHADLPDIRSFELAEPGGERHPLDRLALASGTTDPQTSVRRLVRKDGTSIWAKAHISGLHHEGVLLAMVCLEDWTAAHWHSEDLPRT